MLQARSLPIPVKMTVFSFWKVLFNLQTICILYVEQNSKTEAAFQQAWGMLLVTALWNALGPFRIRPKKNQVQGAEIWQWLWKDVSTYKLACAHTTANETTAYVLAVFSTFVLKLSPAAQSSTCVTLTGNEPQCLLGNHPCSTNSRLTSWSLPLPFLYWPLGEQLWVQTKATFSIHTHRENGC